MTSCIEVMIPHQTPIDFEGVHQIIGRLDIYCWLIIAFPFESYTNQCKSMEIPSLMVLESDLICSSLIMMFSIQICMAPLLLAPRIGLRDTSQEDSRFAGQIQGFQVSI